MKIINIGNGKVGSVLCKLLVNEEKIEKIICCDLKITNKIDNKKIVYKKINAKSYDDVCSLLKKEKPDILINNSIPNFNKNLLQCCLDKKVNYIDLASCWNYNPKMKDDSIYEVEQLSFNKKFKENKLIGLINAGASPGITNLLAKECSHHLDKVEEIRIRLLEDTRSDKLCFAWSKEWLLDEIATQPLIYKNKKFEIANYYGDEENFKFPGDNGVKKVALIAQEEIGTIPLYIDTKNVNIKMHDNQADIGKFLHKLNLLSKKEVPFGNEKISPLQFMTKILPDTEEIHSSLDFKDAVFGLHVEAEGELEGKKKKVSYSVMYPTQNEVNEFNLSAGFMAYATALSTKLFILSFDKIKHHGVFPPEDLDTVTRNEILSNLKKEKYIRIAKKKSFI